MRYGDVNQREIGSVFLQSALVTFADGSVDAEGEAAFVFKSHDGHIDEGPTITCAFSTPVEDLPGNQIQHAFLTKAMKMVRRLAAMSDDEIETAWQDSIRRASEEA